MNTNRADHGRGENYMVGGINKELESFYQRAGIAEDSLFNRMKQRNVRIQLCLNGINLENVSDSSDDSPEMIEKARTILDGLKLG